MGTQWHALTKKDLLAMLSATEDGLTSAEALTRLRAEGRNELPKKKATSGVVLFLRQCANPLMIILVVAAVVTAVLHEWADTTVILIAIAINIIIGFVQEYRAERALIALVKLVAEEATVLRDGKHMRIPRADVVPGDIVLLASGSRVPADGRLLHARECEVNEVILTGESMPQAKEVHALSEGKRLGERSNMVYAGTTLTRGTAVALVVATGRQTEVGNIAGTIGQRTDEQTPLQAKLAHFSRVISLVVIALAAFVFAIGITKGHSAVEMFSIAVALAVAAIPEGLVVGVTAILAIGMHRLVREHAIVRRLLAAETLGSTTVICSDKTGTITEGEMRLVRVLLPDGSVEQLHHNSALSDDVRVLLTAALSTNDAVLEEVDGQMRTFGSPTERGILLGAWNVGIRKTDILPPKAQRDVVPFTSERQYAAALYGEADRSVLYVVGAPDRIVTMSSSLYRNAKATALTAADRVRLGALLDREALAGGRLIGVALCVLPKTTTRIQRILEQQDCAFLGYLVLEDPVRSGVPALVAEAQRAGVRTVMITGDHRGTAIAIARAIGLPSEEGNVLDGSVLSSLSDDELAERIETTTVFARVIPEEKVRIVAALQARRHVVAMTGDGVNDAPALSRADIGVAVGTATDVAKEAADLVILDNNFGTIVRAIREGRVIMENIRKVTLYLLSDAFAEITIIVGGLLLGVPLPLLAKQILWINLVSDGFPNIALTFDPGEPGVMHERPLPRHAPILDRERKILVVTISLVAGISNLILFLIVFRATNDLALARTMAFTSLALTSLAYVFSCRSLRRSILHANFFSNPALLVAIGFGLLLQIAAVYLAPLRGLLETVPLTIAHWLVIVTVVLLLIAIIEMVKVLFIRRMARLS